MSRLRRAAGKLPQPHPGPSQVAQRGRALQSPGRALAHRHHRDSPGRRTRAYLHAVIDNDSRRILAWRVADRSTAANSVATFNTFKLAISFEPNDAEILETRVRAEGNGGSWGALGYASQQYSAPGTVRLANVGFAPAGVMRPLYAAKTLEVRLKVEVDARLPTGDVVTATGFVDRRGDEGGSERFLTLFDCGPLALPAARRYSVQDENIGGDCWGRPNALNLLSDYEFLIVNDVSMSMEASFGVIRLIRVASIWTYDTSATVGKGTR